MSYQPSLKFIRKFVEETEITPTLDKSKIQAWLDCNYLTEFFDRTSSDWILVHLSTKDYFLNSFTIDSIGLDHYRSKEALELSYSLPTSASSCGYGWSGEEKKYFYESNYEDGLGKTKMLPLFFHRNFDGYKKGHTSYYEIHQEYLHLADLHFVKEKSGFCTLSEVGELEEKILIIEEENLKAILFDRNELEKYLLYRGQFLCRFLDLKRAMPAADWGSTNKQEEVIKCSSDKNTWIRLSPIMPADLNKSCDYIRATQVILPSRTIEELENPKKEYASFIIQDWKNEKVIDYSCDPDALDSYFEDTGKPFQTSPVYFKADVLLKYKMEPERYELRERSIYCRGAWSLKTYDINAEGQVHTYICYLGDLPHREQLHWKQYNENPKGNIAERAFKTDFKAEWVAEYNPLQKIKSHFKTFPKVKSVSGDIEIWKPKENLDILFSKIHYVSAGKIAEYKDFLMAATILVIDGLDSAALTELVKGHTKYNKDTKSLGCLKLLLDNLGVSEEAVTAIIKPLRTLQEKRSKYAGHGGSTPDFDLVKDCRKTLEEIEVSLNGLIGILNSKILN